MFEEVGVPVLKDVRGRFSDGFYELEIPEYLNSMDILNKFANSELIEIAHLNILGEISAIEPDDTYYENFFHWNLGRISMPNAWIKTTGNSNIKIAVLDMGVEYSHPDLAKNIHSFIGYDFYDMDNNPTPENLSTSYNAHGTCVAGVICGNTNNNAGISGISGGWGTQKGISLISYRIGNNGVPDFAAAADAFDDAVDKDVDVICCSWNSSSSVLEPGLAGSFALENSIFDAVLSDIIVVFAAGNIKVYKPANIPVRWPVNMFGVLTVGASTKLDKRKEYQGDWGSCYGTGLEVVAPGVEIPTTDNSGQCGYSSTDYHTNFKGTSAAAPHVAALAGLILSVNPTLSKLEVENIIKNTAVQVSGYSYDINGFNNEVGYGRINANAALNATPLPLSVNISGPTFLAGDNGTFTANASGGTTPYTNYQWWYRNDGVIGMKAPPVGTWIYISHYEGQSSISYGPDFCFSLKCIVTDSNNKTAEDIHSVTVIDGLKKGASDSNDSIIPSTNKLKSNYPNPFNPSTTIEYDLSENSDVILTVMSISGHIVKKWEFNGQNPGTYRIQWDGRKDNGQELTSGMYIYQLKTSNFSDTKKMVYMK